MNKPDEYIFVVSLDHLRIGLFLKNVQRVIRAMAVSPLPEAPSIITVMPKNRITKQGADKWITTGAPFGFEMFETSSLIMARKKARELIC